MKRVALAVGFLVGCSLALDLDDQDAAPPDAAVDATAQGLDARAPLPDATWPPPDARHAPTPDARADLPPGCSPERCNEVDDDCDGVVDEDWANLGAACVVGLGRCERRGSRVCLGGSDACDAVPGEGRDEVCDRVDDDCDGVVDEGTGDCCEPSEQRPCGRDIGACIPGRQVCGLGGEWGACTGAVGASLEACNGGDDDCDGAVDEGLLDCDPCVDGAVEVCNGRDDDCDGVTDEGLRNACGACGPLPSEDCDGVDDDCDGVVDERVRNACGGCGPVPAEGCNERDDDCDGAVDEGVLNACGLCGAVPEERCNGMDDDCDGAVDEGFMRLGEVCSSGVGGCRVEGTIVCAAGGFNIVCDAEPGDAVAEVCNDVDDDCDGGVDEGVRNACGACGPVPSEVCNEEDDDCDGRVDEDFDLDRDVNNCSRCNVRCRPAADRCRGGRCVCGAEGFCEGVCIDGRCEDLCGFGGGPPCE